MGARERGNGGKGVEVAKAELTAGAAEEQLSHQQESGPVKGQCDNDGLSGDLRGEKRLSYSVPRATLSPLMAALTLLS